uniref:Uncharacterized protein n=1 Tax=Balaenoptera musculus TaxID=9771 RepID=A0A8C0CJ68_BALMU
LGSHPHALSLTIMGYFLSLLQLLSTCVAVSLVASVGTWVTGPCLVLLLHRDLNIFIVGLRGLQSRLHLFWDSLLVTCACHATLLRLSASILFAITYIQFLPHSPFRDHAIAATAFSWMVSVAHTTQAAWTCALTGEFSCYTLTLPGLLNRLEIFMACVIFAFICSPHLYQQQPALVHGHLAELVQLEQQSSIPAPIFHLGLTLLSVLLYTSAVVLWPLYQFVKKFGRQPRRSSDVSCRDRLTSYVCVWEPWLPMAILTAINPLIYVAALVDLARRFFLSGSEALHRASQFPLVNGSFYTKL